jgi:hypothetical protein
VTDRDAIIEAMVRYGRAVDTRDYALLETCFTEDAVIRYSPTFGDEVSGRAGLELYLLNALTPLDATQHLFANFEVEVAATGAHGRFRCGVQAQHVRSNLPGGHLFTVGGRYENDAIRGQDGVWRINLLEFEPTWTGGNPAVLAHVMPPDAPPETAESGRP